MIPSSFMDGARAMRGQPEQRSRRNCTMFKSNVHVSLKPLEFPLRISDHLFRLESFRAHLVLFSEQNSVVTDAILSLNDLSFSKSHLNWQKDDKRSSSQSISAFV